METKKSNKKSSRSQRAVYYQIDDVLTDFDSLYNAKKHFFFYTPQEIVENFYPKTYICGFNNIGELVTITDVIVDEFGRYRFRKTCKLCVTRL